jgi:2-hydroxycyclohexanecarboxyl-CoA dehydrogenase
MVGRLENKVAIITGGAGGIGAATGLLFCQEGSRVVLVDSDSDAMGVAVSHIQDTVPGAGVVAVVADVAKEETASEVVAQTRKAFGAIDVLANIAAGEKS